MKQLPVPIGELAYILEDASPMASHYLDLETGDVIMIVDEIGDRLEELYIRAYALDPDSSPDLTALIDGENLHDWQKSMLLDADRVDQGLGSRYVRVPHGDSRAGYFDMLAFVRTVENKSLRNRLERAIHGRGVFRRFRDVLSSDDAERKRWLDFRERRGEQRAVEWLAEQGIEPLPAKAAPDKHPAPDQHPAPDKHPAPQEDPGEPLPPVRSRLLAEVLAFVRAAARLPGVLRVALIGSLATDKAEPKDVDLLVTVAGEADLAPLAALGRKLNGHCMAWRDPRGFSRRGEVFLADPQGCYLGRTCPWKECRPGVRMRCDALHCGRRPYLHDDLQVVRLDDDLVRTPPIELWPAIVARVPVPDDVEQELLGLLRLESGA